MVILFAKYSLYGKPLFNVLYHLLLKPLGAYIAPLSRDLVIVLTVRAQLFETNDVVS